ncbi:MAG: hydantoinase/oxoprolinase family protein [Acidimicrobiia bacterium]|nr:hydantoinase/oxoprolinase family protein [Acidimicrobiia bacterium]
MRIGSDTGGTFTDLVAADGRIVKVPSTPDDPGRAVADGVAALAGDLPDGDGGHGGDVPASDDVELTHGTTVATNAVLERTVARVALYTTAGFGDIIEIARQDRPSLYDLTVDRSEALVARADRLDVVERLRADGTVDRPVDIAGLPDPPPGAASLAVVLLHADLDASHERQVAAALVPTGLPVTCSHEVSPELREYERTSTTVVNAALVPVCRSYLAGLEATADEVAVMTSAGGLIPVDEAARQPARLLLSGPAGGVLAAAAVAAANGLADVVSFDMGGTSTDVCLVLGGVPDPAAEREVDGYPVRLPSLDVHTIGAGGGSIARIDEGGALRVGPRSAGAVPGPACYGHGGTAPTVTDANLVAGRIPDDHPFPGLGSLDRAAAERALAAAGVEAEGVLAVVNAEMERALRQVTVERGVEPSSLALVAFGGAGPLHACDLAEALGIPTVVVPARAGVFSAVGILCAPRQEDLVRSWPTPADHEGVPAALEALAAEAVAGLGATDASGPAGDAAAGGAGEGGGTAGGTARSDPPIRWAGARSGADCGDRDAAGGGIEVRTLVDCRYAGQSHELSVPSVAEFHEEHRRRNGYARPDAPIEVVALRASARRAAPVRVEDLPAPQRSGAIGPAVVAEDDCTIWVPDGWEARPGAAGALLLTKVSP